MKSIALSKTEELESKLPKSPIDQAMSMIGDEHILCIIHNLRMKPMRFNELQRAIHGLNPATLTCRLKQLEEDGLVSRQKLSPEKISVTYDLTEKGQAIVPVIDEIAKFADRYIAA